MASTTAMIVAITASWKLRAARSLISSMMGEPVHIDVPKSSRRMPHIHVTNCHHIGWSRPRRARSLSRFSFWAKALSPAKRSSTMSPGTTRIRKKISTATPRSVGIIKSSRLTMYFAMPSAARLLGQPHRVELLVQVVARRDRPSPDLGAVGDDAVPLERREGVRLFFEQPPLELPDVPLPLLGIEGSALLLVEIVEHLVGVAAVVVVADLFRLELGEVEVRLDLIAALGVARHREVAGPQLRHVLRGLDRDHGRVEPDLAPLVDEPDPDRLVRHRDPAVREGEGEAVGDAGLPQQATRLGPRLLDVAAVAGELLELVRRRRERRARHLHPGHLFHVGDFRERLSGLMPVQGERQRAADALVVEGLLVLVYRHPRCAVPGTLLH